MSETDNPMLDEALVRLLRAEIGRIRPPVLPKWDPPVRSRRQRSGAVSARLALVFLGLLALTEVFITGSTDPREWARRTQGSINASSTVADPSPSTPSTPAPDRTPGSSLVPFVPTIISVISSIGSPASSHGKANGQSDNTGLAHGNRTENGQGENGQGENGNGPASPVTSASSINGANHAAANLQPTRQRSSGVQAYGAFAGTVSTKKAHGRR